MNQTKLPALVNVHSHTFQRAIRGRTEHRTAATPDNFWTWRETMYRAANLLSPEDIYDVARMAFLEMALSGITTVGEFHYLHHAPDGTPYQDRNLLALEVVRAAREVGLRIALLRTAYTRAGWQRPANPAQARFLTPRPDDFLRDTEDLRARLRDDSGAWVGVAPHSVRALPLDYLREIAAYARATALPLHMHVSEQPAEIDQCIAEHGVRPIELLQEHGILDASFTGIHAIHITTSESDYLGAAHARVCACPTSERNLGDGPVPADRLNAAGVEICFGSDSNVQIDILEDARLLEYDLRMEKLQRAILDPARLFAGATEVGAAALHAPASGDFFTIDLDDPSIAGAEPSTLLNNVIFSLERTAIREVVVGGKIIVQDGRHPLAEEITRRFRALQERLWRS
jgi:formimidoylglutamate deiminase